MTDKDIIQEEIQKIREDILKLYAQKRATGEFERELDIRIDDKGFEIWGLDYLKGRKPGIAPPISDIEEWMDAKNINPIEVDMKRSSLAFLIARAIGKKGTKDSNELDVYEQVLTPERFEKIINRVSVFHVEEFSKEIVDQLTKIFK